ncbi:hypothetical protein NEMBOFW57_007604 [Staphylotrichum longicolle]|uniref:Major facilitator superfamily transporter n=1 Tax=Staphylotrichum longicolle TaxID=669026 RepID=A0AAD4EYK8_9PEZI|nr:hypothetical protein NEMBOFW57_007604 [Staphylotrichum longicolle]
MNQDEAKRMGAAPSRDMHHDGRDEGGEWRSSSSVSSSAPATGKPKRLTPDTGSDGEDDEGAGGDEQSEWYELRGVRVKHEEEEEEEGGAGGPRRRSRRRRQRRELYTAEEEQAVVRKFDRRLVVFVAGLYMLSFLDRSNIGNARVAGMDDDLQSVPRRDGWYEWSLAAFYITYIAFEWMSLVWRVVPAHIYVAGLVLSWGVIASLQAVTVNYPMLVVLRALLGIGEAGFTGVPFYLSFFFKRHELAFRTAIFISGNPLRPPYLASFLLVLATAHASDAARARAPFLAAHALLSALGYAVLALSSPSFLSLPPASIVRYLAVYPAAIGFFNVVVLTVAWSINNQRGTARQGAGFALMQVVGQCGPLVGTRLYPDADGPYYTRGMAVCAVAMGVVAVLVGVLRWWLGRMNRRWEREERRVGKAGRRGRRLLVWRWW